MPLSSECPLPYALKAFAGPRAFGLDITGSGQSWRLRETRAFPE